jgi:hypothetical protein
MSFRFVSVLSNHFPGATREKHENLQTLYPNSDHEAAFLTYEVSGADSIEMYSLLMTSL